MTARDLVEASRHLARLSRDQMIPMLERVLGNAPEPFRSRQAKLEQECRMALVMDCYLTGCAETIKRIMGDNTPEPWEENYNHEARLDQLLAKFNEFQTKRTEAAGTVGSRRKP